MRMRIFSRERVRARVLSRACVRAHAFACLHVRARRVCVRACVRARASLRTRVWCAHGVLEIRNSRSWKLLVLPLLLLLLLLLLRTSHARVVCV